MMNADEAGQLGSHVFLSIAIPTFNRASRLVACLEMLSQELNGFLGSIEIVISDNASTDSTKDVVSQWQMANSGVDCKYYSNEKNLGVDANCHLAIDRSAGDFVWLFCDDDRIVHGGLRKVFNELLGNPGVIFCYVNYFVRTGSKDEPSTCREKGTSCIRGEELLNRTRFAVSFASSCIFKKEVWVKVNPSQYIGTNWYHMYAARDLLPKGKALLIGYPVVIMNGLDLATSRAEKRRSDASSCEFYIAAHINFLSFAFTLDKFGYTKEACLNAREIGWANNIRQIFYYKATIPAYKSRELGYIAGRMSCYFWTKPIFWLVHLPLLILPSFVTGNIYRTLSPIYKRIKQPQVDIGC